MKQIFKIFCIFFMFAAVFALSACQNEGPAEKAGKTVDETTVKVGDKMENAGDAVVKGAENVGDYMDDTAITAKIKADILQDPLLNVFEIDVVTTDRVVKLGGTVDSKLSIDRATEIARSVKDVNSVQNNMLIKE
ncbi:MAG: BON domain-containing protein [Desulfomicrobium sp.]|nr:BON domain-containing protein [Pseudomonadota bacterium]MBV1710529.1 BON domain-containing protein [Desulfomicrobium sp.]MBU4570137.1 BON domain-containing protein [Pseudomonadota bacterium]MBU4593057.1 BON domain-containing protein [Pseudomonadota bacterium]MBV1718866.1 BON domain-containing protein [Desulfomicrobium sp.]